MIFYNIGLGLRLSVVVEGMDMLIRHRESRKSVRRFMRRAATVSFGVERPPANCEVWDISESGARLAVALPMADLPRHFILNLFADGSLQRRCEVVWSDRRSQVHRTSTVTRGWRSLGALGRLFLRVERAALSTR
jgi:hypothetical protein